MTVTRLGLLLRPTEGGAASVVARVQRGDRAAFDELYERLLPLAYAFAARRLRSREAIETVTADALETVFERLDGLETPPEGEEAALVALALCAVKAALARAADATARFSSACSAGGKK